MANFGLAILSGLMQGLGGVGQAVQEQRQAAALEALKRDVLQQQLEDRRLAREDAAQLRRDQMAQQTADRQAQRDWFEEQRFVELHPEDLPPQWRDAGQQTPQGTIKVPVRALAAIEASQKRQQDQLATAAMARTLRDYRRGKRAGMILPPPQGAPAPPSGGGYQGPMTSRPSEIMPAAAEMEDPSQEALFRLIEQSRPEEARRLFEQEMARDKFQDQLNALEKVLGGAWQGEETEQELTGEPVSQFVPVAESTAGPVRPEDVAPGSPRFPPGGSAPGGESAPGDDLLMAPQTESELGQAVRKKRPGGLRPSMVEITDKGIKMRLTPPADPLRNERAYAADLAFPGVPWDALTPAQKQAAAKQYNDFLATRAGLRPVPGETATRIAQGEMVMGNLDALERLLTSAKAEPVIEGYTGPYAQYRSETQRRAPFQLLGKVPPEVTELEFRMAVVENMILRLLSGAQVVEPEHRRIKRELPDQRLSKEENLVRLRLSKTNTVYLARRVRQLALRGDPVAKRLAEEYNLEDLGAETPGPSAPERPAPSRTPPGRTPAPSTLGSPPIRNYNPATDQME